MIANQEVYSIFAPSRLCVFAFLFTNLTRKAQKREGCYSYRHVFRVCQHITDTFAKKAQFVAVRSITHTGMMLLMGTRVVNQTVIIFVGLFR